MSWYREVYLQSEDWKNLRAAVLSSPVFDGRCFLCARKKRLDVHHINYRNLYDVNTADLVPLCRECHDKVHAFKDYMENWEGGCIGKLSWADIMDEFCPADTERGKFQRVQMIVWRILAFMNPAYTGHKASSILGVYKKFPQYKDFLDKCLG